ncbi:MULTISPECIES: hypothetical protein [unclassified Variovorax]|jgi:cytoskeletal protein RodZ|uniref:hypothetical protein n=1 Tax=unclassified Variovorax TaxID=663243 RepID=UPI000F7F93BF|nr:MULTISPECIES: hypothetical protein [unclassified Variovorax]RSZ38202.1 hypothetical protein EJO70_18855 [Variovorax sp. 553]RSZ39347.1 hypothetical protein EJO71_20395 [Variovorax sp. 679]
MSTDDEHDAMRERREAMTAWERGLRPRPERHLALWLALAVLVVFLFYLAAEWLLTQRPAHRPIATPPVATQPSTTARPSPPVAPSPSQGGATTPDTFEVTKCLAPSGKAAYSDGPCPEGSRATTVRLRRDVNIADGMSPQDREASIRNNAVIAAQQQQYERQVAQNVDRGMAECSELAERIKWLDALGRQPQGTYSQDWLREERRRTRDRQFRLGCP